MAGVRGKEMNSWSHQSIVWSEWQMSLLGFELGCEDSTVGIDSRNATCTYIKKYRNCFKDSYVQKCLLCSSERHVTYSRHQLWKYKENVQLVILFVNAVRFHNVRLTPMRSGAERIEIQDFQLFWTWPLSLKTPHQKKKDSVYWEVIYFLLIHSKNFQMSFEVANVWKVIEKWRSLSE